MQYNEIKTFERDFILNYSPETVYFSLKNINRLHKWHPHMYFHDPGPHLLENTYQDWYGDRDNGYVIITNYFNLIDGDVFLRPLVFLHRRPGDMFSVSRNRLHIECEKVDDENSTKVIITRRLLIIGDRDDINNKSSIDESYTRTDQIANAISSLAPGGIDNLLVLPNKPTR